VSPQQAFYLLSTKKFPQVYQSDSDIAQGPPSYTPDRESQLSLTTKLVFLLFIYCSWPKKQFFTQNSIET